VLSEGEAVTDSQLERLRATLAAAPDNVLLRLGLIRRLIDLGEEAEALSLALDLDPAAVTGASDRRVVAALFNRAGLADRAEALEAEDAGDAPSDGQPANEDATGGQPPSDGRVLRLVGGQDAGDADIAALPDVEIEPATTFADVGGLEDVKKDIHRRIILPFAQPSLIRRFRKRAGGGVLVYGPPGCGKTLLARATAGECGAKFVTAHLSEVLDPYIGRSEQRLSEIFRTARGATPSVLFFDEIEALGAKRSTSTSSHIAQLASHFLSEMDGVDKSNDGVLILAATNAPWAMDAAFLRPGRFDRLFFVPPPDRAARRQIFDLELDGRLAVGNIDTGALAAATSGRSGADVRAIVEIAADAAIDATLEAGQEVPISQAMLSAAVSQTRSTVAEWLTTARNHATYSNEGGRYDEILRFLEMNGRRR